MLELGAGCDLWAGFKTALKEPSTGTGCSWQEHGPARVRGSRIAACPPVTHSLSIPPPSPRLLSPFQENTRRPDLTLQPKKNKSLPNLPSIFFFPVLNQTTQARARGGTRRCGTRRCLHVGSPPAALVPEPLPLPRFSLPLCRRGWYFCSRLVLTSCRLTHMCAVWLILGWGGETGGRCE